MLIHISPAFRERETVNSRETGNILPSGSPAEKEGPALQDPIRISRSRSEADPEEAEADPEGADSAEADPAEEVMEEAAVKAAEEAEDEEHPCKRHDG